MLIVKLMAAPMFDPLELEKKIFVICMSDPELSKRRAEEMLNFVPEIWVKSIWIYFMQVAFVKFSSFSKSQQHMLIGEKG